MTPPPSPEALIQRLRNHAAFLGTRWQKDKAQIADVLVEAADALASSQETLRRMMKEREEFVYERDDARSSAWRHPKRRSEPRWVLVQIGRGIP